MAAEAIRWLHRELEVDPGPWLDRPEGGHLECLVHRLDLEPDVVDRGRGEADAVDGDGVALADFGDEPGGDVDPGAFVAAVDVLDLADVLDEAGEHVTTP